MHEVSLTCPGCGAAITVDAALQRKPITPSLARMLTFIKGYMASAGYPPRLEDIAERLGYRSISGVQEALGKLEERGYIRREKGIPRGLSLLAPPGAHTPCASAPAPAPAPPPTEE